MVQGSHGPGKTGKTRELQNYPSRPGKALENRLKCLYPGKTLEIQQHVFRTDNEPLNIAIRNENKWRFFFRIFQNSNILFSAQRIFLREKEATGTDLDCSDRDPV